MTQERVSFRFPFQVPVTEIPSIVHDMRKRQLGEMSVVVEITYPESPEPFGANMFPNPRRGGPFVFVTVTCYREHEGVVKERFDEISAGFTKKL